MRSKLALSLVAIAGALIVIPTATAAPAGSAMGGMERLATDDGGIVEKVHRKYRYVHRRHYYPRYYASRPYYRSYGPYYSYYSPYRRSGFSLYLSF